MWYTCYYKQTAVRQYSLLSANEGQSECASCSSASFVSFSCSSCPSSSGSVTSSDSGNRKGDFATVDASIQKDYHRRELFLTCGSSCNKCSTSTQWKHIFLFLIIQRRTSTLAAALPFVCVLPVEGLVVFSTVGHSVTAGAGFAPGTTTHPAKLQSGDGQHAVVRFRLTRRYILWRNKEEKSGHAEKQFSHLQLCCD